MNRQMLRSFLYRINVWQSTSLLCLLSSPWLIYLLSVPPTHDTGKLWADTAMLFFVLSFLLYLFLKLITRLRRSDFRKTVVTFTRVYIRFHVATAILGVSSLLMHVTFMVLNGWAQTIVGKSGIFAIAALAPLLITGYLRKKKSSGKRRRYHRYTAYIFLISAIIHMIL